MKRLNVCYIAVFLDLYHNRLDHISGTIQGTFQVLSRVHFRYYQGYISGTIQGVGVGHSIKTHFIDRTFKKNKMS